MKKRMKRILSVVLAGVMVFSLAACGNEKKEQENNTGDTGKTLCGSLIGEPRKRSRLRRTQSQDSMRKILMWK